MEPSAYGREYFTERSHAKNANWIWNKFLPVIN